MSDHCDILRVITHNHYLDLGNGSNKFENHCVRLMQIIMQLLNF